MFIYNRSDTTIASQGCLSETVKDMIFEASKLAENHDEGQLQSSEFLDILRQFSFTISNYNLP